MANEAITSERQQKGLVIAATSKITKRGNETWIVPSQSIDTKYAVTVTAEGKECTCPDYELRQQPCKHIFAVQYVLFREQVTETKPDGTVTTTTTEAAQVRVTYRQDWPKYNAAQTTEREHFCRLLRDLVSSVPTPDQKGAGRRFLPLSERLFAAAFKVYSGVSGRRFMTELREARDAGLIEHAPHYNTIFEVIESEDVMPILRSLIEKSSTPLKAVETNFAIDSTGFGSSTYFRYYSEKYGREATAHDWIKVHAVVGVKTNVVTTAEATYRDTGDSPYLKPLLEETARNFTIEEVSADKAYLSHQNIDVVAGLGGTPYIPFKANSRDSGEHALWNKLYHLFSLQRETWLQHYHKRSNVESTFSAIKRVFGGSVRSRTPIAQMNEALLKIICHNIRCLIHAMFEMGIDPTFGTCPAIPEVARQLPTT